METNTPPDPAAILDPVVATHWLVRLLREDGSIAGALPVS